MGIGYVNGASAETAAASALTVTYNPTIGNEIVVGIMFNGSVTGLTCKDNNSNALTLVTNKNNCYQFQGKAITGTTGYTFSWTTPRAASAAVAEYSGVIGIGTNNTNSGSTAPANLSVVTTKVNSVVVGVFGIGGNVTSFPAATGNIRLHNTAGAGNASSICLADNTGITASTNVTVAVSGTTTLNWNGVGVEVYPFIGNQLSAYELDIDQQMNPAILMAPNVYTGTFYNIDGDISDTHIALPPALGVVSDSVILGYTGYRIPPQYMLQSDDGEEKITIPVNIWDNDGENQLLNPAYTTDRDVSDAGVERITYSSGVLMGHDTDAENQLQQQLWYQDGDLSDSSVEHIIIPLLIQEDIQQLPLALLVQDIIELQAIQVLPPVLDLDADHQMQQLPFIPDKALLEESVINLIIPILDYTWDDDAENQLQQYLQLNDDVLEANVANIILPPFIDIVEVVGEDEE